MYIFDVVSRSLKGTIAAKGLSRRFFFSFASLFTRLNISKYSREYLFESISG